MDLQDRTVLITGAARGIGTHLAAELVRRGANVALVGLEPHELAARAAQLGERCAPFVADVRDQAALEAAVAGAVKRFGAIDVVVANAGVANLGTVRTTDPDAFALTVDVNLTGVFRTVRAALPHVIARRGHVLVISSMSAFAPVAGMAAYTASKAG
ncbi:MAG TPA: SDR family NAD(P)-dependent oxidoreductase, partial [Solirubrobacteraceae bacterium]|nr:SDR family NAD(P)-dependent oxidoreductase [Solirubrobacteraceae bacterium]